jgi:hypothetical protein
MGTRVRYLTADPISRRDLADLTEELCRKEYSDEVAWGYVDVRNERDSLVATFVERFETEEQVIHPFGEVTTYKRIQFNPVRFRIRVGIPQLEVYDCPRSATALLTELSNCFGARLVFSTVRIDLGALIQALKQQTTSLSLLAATLGDVSLSTDVFARIAVNGSAEITPYLKKVSFGREPVLERVLVKGTVSSSGGFKVEATSDARIHIQVGHSDSLVKVFRGAVVESIS